MQKANEPPPPPQFAQICEEGDELDPAGVTTEKTQLMNHELLNWEHTQQKLLASLKDTLFLEQLAAGAQGRVQVAYNESLNQLLAVKHVHDAREYAFEKAAYKYLAANGLAHVSVQLVDSNDEHQLLVLERGRCDLDAFVKLRTAQKNPLTGNELFFVARTVADSMAALAAVGVSVCDVKGANLLLKYDFESMGYFPVITDLGGVYCPSIDAEREYGMFYTPQYFDEALLQRLVDANRSADAAEIVHNELYALCRTLLWCGVESVIDDGVRVRARALFRDQKQQARLLREVLIPDAQKYQQQSESDECAAIVALAPLIEDVLVHGKYDDFGAFVQRLDALWDAHAPREGRAATLKDPNGAVMEWIRKKIDEKGKFDCEEDIEELEALRQKCFNLRLHDQVIGVSHRILDRLSAQKRQHEQNHAEQGPLCDEVDFKIASCHLMIGLANDELGKAHDALRHYDAYAHILRDVQNDTHQFYLATVCNNRGNIYRDQGRLDDALAQYEKAQHIYAQHCASDTVDLAASDTYNNIGNVYYKRGEVEKALAHYEKCLRGMVHHYGTDNRIEMANPYNNIGVMHYEQGRLADALDNYNKALRAIVTHFGDANHIHTANTYLNIGIVHRLRGQLEDATRFHERAIKIRAAYYGNENHFELILYYHYLGVLKRDLGHLQHALSLQERAVRIGRQHYGSEENFELAKVYTQIGIVYLDMRRLDDAEEMLKRAISIRVRHFESEENFDIAESYEYLGEVYTRRSLQSNDPAHTKKARSYLKKSRAIRVAHYKDDNHYQLAHVYEKMSTLYVVTAKIGKAKALAEKAYDIKQAHYGAQSFALATTYMCLGVVAAHEKDTANDHFKRALRIAEKHYGKDHIKVKSMREDVDMARSVCARK